MPTTYNYIATAPCVLILSGKRVHLQAGDAYSVSDKNTAAYLSDYTHPQHRHLRLVSTEGEEELMIEPQSRGQQILDLLSTEESGESGELNDSAALPPLEIPSESVKVESELELGEEPDKEDEDGEQKKPVRKRKHPSNEAAL